MLGRIPTRWFALALALWSVVLYLNSLSGTRVYDDKPVLRNPDVTGERPFVDLFSHDFWGHAMWGGKGWSHLSYRPLAVMTLRLNWFLGDGDLVGFHATNIAIHTAVVLLALQLCLRLFPRTRRLEAIAAAFLFASHPLHAEVVSNITGRAETLAAACVLASMLCYVCAFQARRKGTEPSVSLRAVLSPTVRELAWVLASGVCIAGAVLCKETGLITPGLLGALEVALVLPHIRGPGGDATTWAGRFRASQLGRFLYACCVALCTPRMVGAIAYGIAGLWFRFRFLPGGYVLFRGS